MVCQTRMSIITPPVTYFYAAFFTIGGIMAVISNFIVLIILWLPEHRSRSNKLLTSLAASDLFVGLTVFPITAYQMFHYASLSSCNIDFARIYYCVALQGSSCMVLGVIAYDRYILMTKTNAYYKPSMRKFIIALVTLSWLICCHLFCPIRNPVYKLLLHHHRCQEARSLAEETIFRVKNDTSAILQQIAGTIKNQND